MNEIINFSLILHAEERFGSFMQDGATPHTAQETIRVLRGVFGEIMGRIELLVRVCWRPTSPDLNPCDFYL
jgi:hypothetical protein